MATRFGVGLLVLFVLLGGEAWAASPEVSTPPLVSGRKANDADVTVGDVLARTILLRENVELLRSYMGLPKAPTPLVRATGASIGEAYFGGLSLRYRSSQLSFELLRSERPWRRPPLPRADVAPVDLLAMVDASLRDILRVKAHLGITTEVEERRQPDDASTNELYVNLFGADGEIEHLVLRKATPGNTFFMLTEVVRRAMELHLAKTKKVMPREPPLEPGKTPADVFKRLMECFLLIDQIAQTVKLPVLTLAPLTEDDRQPTVMDVMALTLVIVAELDRLSQVMELPRPPVQPYAPLRKFPSHVYQRVELLKKILDDVVAAVGPAKKP